MPSVLDRTLDRLMRPCTLVMDALSMRAKILCLAAVFVLPTAWLALDAILKDQDQVRAASAQMHGTVLIRQITDVALQTQSHRGLTNLKFAGQDVDGQLGETRTVLGRQLERLRQLMAGHEELAPPSAWKPAEDALRQLGGGSVAATAPESLRQHTELIGKIFQFSDLVAEKSGLLQTGNMQMRLLTDAAVQKLPRWIEGLAILRGLGAGYLKAGSIDVGARAGLLARLETLKVYDDDLAAGAAMLQRAGRPVDLAGLKSASQEFSRHTQDQLLGEQVNGDAQAYFAEGTRAIAQAAAAHNLVLKQLGELLQEQYDAASLRRNLLVSGLLLLLLATAYLGFGFYRAFMQALDQVAHSSQAVASGDLTQSIHIHGKDELAQTGATLEKMNLNLSALVANVRTNASMVSQLGEGLAEGISDLTTRTEQQASSLEQTTASIEDLAETVQKNAESAKAVNGLATNLHMIAESSGSSMDAAVTSMQGIQSSAIKAQEIVGIIDALAFQTNLLALNAAVEAARAGEQGRGFAVVASEVRSLAQRSAESARQIKRLIDDSVARVETGVTQIHGINETMSDIIKGIGELAGNMNAISTASTEQSNGLAQISSAIRHLDEITQQNGAMAEQAKLTSNNLEERAINLTRAVAQFRLRQGTADEAYALVKKAVALFQKQGRGALATITEDKDKNFADRDMYVFAFDDQGQYRAFGGNAAKLQVNILNIPGLDGRKLLRDAFALPATGGWVDYTIVNPLSKKVEAKTSYIERVADRLVIGCGVYKVV